MQQTPPEVITAYIGSLLFWVLAVVLVWLVGSKWARFADFRDCMLRQCKPALGIAFIYVASAMLKGLNVNWFGSLAGGIMTFCQALIGLALARRIAGFEALPVARAIAGRQRIARSLALMAGFALLAVAASVIAGAVGTGVARALGEIRHAGQSEQSSMPALWQLFFYFLAGAGIAEETVYRLVIVSLVWGLSRRRWLAIGVSGLLFGAYHLTPVSGMYLTFWQYPLTQFLSSALIGMVWAYLYIRRGYETAVLAHTLSDWLPIAASMALMN